MRPFFPIIKQLLLRQIERNKQRAELEKQLEILSKMGITISLTDDIDFMDIALDIIGFPADNTVEFDFAALSGNSPEAGAKGKRTDFDNMFSRDYLEDRFYVNEMGADQIDEYIEFLYSKYDELMLEELGKPTRDNDRVDSTESKTPSYEEMKLIEPALDTIEREVIARNEEAAEEEIWWCDVWAEIKPALQNSVGVYCDHPELMSSACWDEAGRHLESLATNMK